MRYPSCSAFESLVIAAWKFSAPSAVGTCSKVLLLMNTDQENIGNGFGFLQLLRQPVGNAVFSIVLW